MEHKTRVKAYRQLSFLERNYLAQPKNVVMIANILGKISESEMKTALEKTLTKYPILGTRFELDDKGACWLIPEHKTLPLKTITRVDSTQWMHIAEAEHRDVFDLESGPPIRFTQLISGSETTLMITCHHSICDGLSLCYLLEDLLTFISNPILEATSISDPKLDLEKIIPIKNGSPLQRLGIWYYNKKWRSGGVSFSFSDYNRLFDAFWEKNSGNRVEAIELQPEETKALVQDCRHNKVTVNTALVTAMFAAQFELEDNGGSSSVVLPVNVRDRYSIKAEKTFGLFALGNQIGFEYDKERSFWDNTKRLQGVIEFKTRDAEINRVQIRRYFPPYFFDSQYFVKYDVLDNPMAKKLLDRTRMGDHLSALGVTNLGRLDIPYVYGDLKIASIYGPCVYSDLTDKTIGITTINDVLTITLTYNAGKLGSYDVKEFFRRITTRIGYEWPSLG